MIDTQIPLIWLISTAALILSTLIGALITIKGHSQEIADIKGACKKHDEDTDRHETHRERTSRAFSINNDRNEIIKSLDRHIASDERVERERVIRETARDARMETIYQGVQNEMALLTRAVITLQVRGETHT